MIPTTIQIIDICHNPLANYYAEESILTNSRTQDARKGHSARPALGTGHGRRRLMVKTASDDGEK
jgi:hypothetical protein